MEYSYKSVLICLSILLIAHQSLAARRSKRHHREGEIRLVGGGRRWRGTVLIMRKGKWSSICDEMWGLNDATVVCKQLGYRGAVGAPIRSKYGPGRKRKWMTGFRCRGSENRLIDCISSRRRRGDNCSGLRRSAGAMCSRNTRAIQAIWRLFFNRATRTRITPSRTTTKSMTATTTTYTTSTTTPTTTTTTTTTTSLPTTTKHVMSDLEEEIAAWAASRSLNESEPDQDSLSKRDRPKSDAPAAPQNGGVYVISPSAHSSGSNVSSRPGEETQDIHITKYMGKVARVRIPVPADGPPNEDVELRIKGGRYKFEGRLEVRFPGGQWGVMCSDQWTLREAMVACRQIGGLGKGKQILQYSYFGGSDMPKLIHRVQCVGNEKSMSECNITKTDGEKCSRITSVAGLVCSDNLPDLVPNLRALQLSARLQDQPLFYLRCSMEENCLANSAYVIRNTSLVWRNNIRRLFRFSTVVHNEGIADFQPFRAKDQWEWHACHMHYHSMEVFAHYDIMDANGNRLAEGSKASFCLEDTICDKGTKPKYNCQGMADQGLSVNCSDNYMYDIDCQWIDITDIKPGDYTFLMEVNPDLLVAESNFDNNVVSCNMYYNGYFASLKNCEHQSLLGYRRPLKIPP